MAGRFGQVNLKTAVSQLRITLGGGSPVLQHSKYFLWGQRSLFLEPSSRKLHASLTLQETHMVNMPSLSPTMTEGTIVKWMKKEGEPLAAGDVLCEIQTDKAVVSLDCDEDGILAKIVMPENSADVKVGTLIALTVDEGDDWKAVQIPGDAAAGSAAPTSAPASSAAPADEVVAAEGVHLVNMPSLSPTMTEGTIVKWMKNEGDKLQAGDVLCEIQTDKAVVSLECDEDGILAKILMPENSADIKVGTLIALTVDEGVDWKTVVVPSAASPTKSSEPKPTAAAASASSTKESDSSHSSTARLIGPAVNHYLKKFGLDPSQVKHSGPHGLVTKGDVLNYALSNNLEPVSQDVGAVGKTAGGPSSEAVASKKDAKPAIKKSKKGTPSAFVDIEVTNMRRTIAKRLVQSKSTIPHAYATAECNVSQMSSLRKRLTDQGVKVSVNDIVIKCTGNALARVPALNCIWQKENLSQQASADISVAVSTPTGLITPIVFSVGSKDVSEISETVRTLAGKARDGKLQPAEFMGGSFTISNLGMFGVDSFSAIINPPQCAILAVGGNCIAIDEMGKAKTTVKLQLSYDATAIGEEDVAKFLAILKNEIETASEVSMGFEDLRARNWN